ncbi:MAG: porin family protein [Loktanella sp.]|nr:porin family protein [Loktanella sp.]
MIKTFKFARTAMLAAPLALAAGMASAGGLAPPVETVAPTPIAPAPIMPSSDWSGFYVGGQLGYGKVTTPVISELDDDFTGAIYGVHAGYMYDLGSIVLGAEIDYDLTSMELDFAEGNGNEGGPSLTSKVDSIMRIKARVGYDAGQFMPYVTGGVVRAEVSSFAEEVDLQLDGDFYGAGVVYKFSDSILIGGEVLQHKFYEGDIEDEPGLGIRATTATARVSFQF